MNWKYVVSRGLFLVLAGLNAVADYVSTSITTDGSFLLASSGQTDNGTYASRVMAADASEITRSMTGDDSLAADISVTSPVRSWFLIMLQGGGLLLFLIPSLACSRSMF